MNLRLLFLSLLTLTFLQTNAQQQFENGSFDEWEEVGLGADKMEPVNWSSIKTSDDDLLNSVAPVIWEKSDDAHSGPYSVRVWNVSTLGLVATGSISNGRFHPDLNTDSANVHSDIGDERWHSAFSWRPDSVAGWFKANSADGDFATVKVALHTGELAIPGDESNIVAMAYIELPPGITDTWTRFSAPFNYIKSINPEFQLTILTAGNGVDAIDGSEAWFDDLEFIYNNSSVGEMLASRFSIYSSGKSIVINTSVAGMFNAEVYDLTGRQIINKQIEGNKRILLNQNSGVYIVRITQKEGSFTQKVIIN